MKVTMIPQQEYDLYAPLQAKVGLHPKHVDVV